MAGLRALQRKLHTITGRKIENDLLLIVKSLESDLIDLNLSQLRKGETAKEKKLPFYAGTNTPWKLFRTGKFYAGWFIKIVRQPMQILFGSRDSKTEMLLDKLENRGIKKPEDIFGLSERNFARFQKLLIPKVKKYFRELLSV